MANYIYTNGQLVNADELYHYGVLGMKWGRRKARNLSTANSTKKKKRSLEEEYGELEDQLTYGKKANTKKNAEISKKMSAIENQMRANKTKGWSQDAIDVSKIRSKKVNEMSNAELKKLNERNQLEITNRELKYKQNRGQRAVSTFIKTAGTITAVAAAAATYQKYGKSILDKVGSLRA